MAIEIDWSDEAQTTFDKNIYYLESEWTDKEVAKFIRQTQQALKRIEKHPESYPIGKKSNRYRRARLNKYIALFYRYNKAQGRVTLVTFWNTKQDPSKLKY